MGKRGRPATKPSGLREGYYLGLQNKGSNSVIKIRRESMAEIKAAIKQFEKSKIVTYLGQVKEGRWVDGENKGKKTA
jgi:hypothetical protein